MEKELKRLQGEIKKKLRVIERRLIPLVKENDQEELTLALYLAADGFLAETCECLS